MDRPIDITEEMDRAAACAVRRVDLFRSIGIPAATVAALGEYAPLGFAKIETLPAGLYQPSEEGQRHLIIPVHDGSGVIDLIATRPDAPRRWHWRIGQACLLGEANLNPPTWEHAPVPIHQTPIDWLRADCTGACVLDFDDVELVPLLGQAQAIICAPTIARLIRLAASRPRPLPQILNWGQSRAA